MKQGKYARRSSWIKTGIKHLGGWSIEPHFGKVSMRDFTFTPLSMSWTEDGMHKTAKYSDLTTATKDPKELRLRLEVALTDTNELLAMEKLKATGKISPQFKRALKTNFSYLVGNIEDFEAMTDMTPEDIKSSLEGYEIDEKGSLGSQDLDTSEKKYKFYHYFGFSELNLFTANIFRSLGGYNDEGSELRREDIL